MIKTIYLKDAASLLFHVSQLRLLARDQALVRKSVYVCVSEFVCVCREEETCSSVFMFNHTSTPRLLSHRTAVCAPSSCVRVSFHFTCHTTRLRLQPHLV